MNTISKNEVTTKEKENTEKSPLVKITRIFNAPIEKVWNAWSDEQLIKQWWGPESYTAPIAKIDFREGGKYTLAMRDASGNMIWSSGVYKVIEPYKTIVSSDYFSDENGNVISAREAGMPGKWPLECIVTVDFSNAHAEQTKIIISHEGIPREMHDECVEGWNSSINKLQKILEHH